jgi:tripartite-type tricarboxylate transporter receptor subunit TctC
MKSATAWTLAVALGLAALPAAADETADFYKDRTVTFTSAGGAGGGYGVYALLLSEHMGRHIPGNPNVIVTYMPGAGGVRAANHAYHVAPKDGTAILAPLQSLATLQLLGKKGLRYDAAKFNWIGRAVETTSGFLVWPEVAKDLEGFKARGEDTVVGVTQPGAPNHIMAALLPYCTGAKVRIVSGYKGSSAIANAYKKKEVHGMALPLDSVRLVHAELMSHTFIAQSGFERSPHFPQVPLLLDLCPDPEKRKIVEVFQTQEVMGRAYAAPPGTPAARVAALRRAFDATMKDPAFRAAAQKRKMELGPKAGAEMQKIVEAHIATESAVVARAKAAVGLK